jgi:hypothetical protein
MIFGPIHPTLLSFYLAKQCFECGNKHDKVWNVWDQKSLQETIEGIFSLLPSQPI